jgi:hypothetical protein
MKNTTQTIEKKAPNGVLYQVSQSFKQGDTVFIHNVITGQVSYLAVIKTYRKLSDGSHIAVVFNCLNNGMYSNTLASALVVESQA